MYVVIVAGLFVEPTVVGRDIRSTRGRDTYSGCLVTCERHPENTQRLMYVRNDAELMVPSCCSSCYGVGASEGARH